MAKKISQLGQLLRTAIASGDKIPILDESAGQTKYVTVGDLVGIPDFGWTASGEAWSYSSWDSDTRIGVVTVPSDATIKYQKGMRVKITQSTGGTKYGIIHAVSSTTLTIFFQTGTTFNNEAITDIFYSGEYAPFGFDAKEANWQLEILDSSARQGNTPTNNTYYVPSGSTANLYIGIGDWSVEYRAIYRVHSSNSTFVTGLVTLSTTTNSETSTELSSQHSSDQTSAGTMTLTQDHYKRRKLSLASKTRYYLLGYSSIQTTMGNTNGFGGGARITATSAYI